MNEHGASKEEAVTALEQMVRDAWKDLNEELVSQTRVSSLIFQLPINLARSYHHSYKEIDGYTYSAKVIKKEASLVYTKAFHV